MLILTRKKGQTVLIGEDHEITVVDIQGARVRLGVRAPENVRVDRGEVVEVRKRQGKTQSQME